MAGAFTEATGKIAEVVARLGGTITLRRYAPVTPDPAQPWRQDPPTATDYTVAAVLDQRVSRTDGTRVDRATISSVGLAIEPTVEDRVVIAGIERVIASVQKEAPDGAPIIFTLELEAWPRIERP